MIIGFAVHRGTVFGEDVCYMFNRISSRQKKPQYLSTDNDPLFRFDQWQSNLRVMDIREMKSIPHVPVSHPFIERLIGTTRREFLDQNLIWNQTDLERKLDQFKNYYNLHRVHSALGPTTPAEKRGDSKLVPSVSGNGIWTPTCNGLFHVFNSRD